MGAHSEPQQRPPPLERTKMRGRSATWRRLGITVVARRRQQLREVPATARHTRRPSRRSASRTPGPTAGRPEDFSTAFGAPGDRFYAVEHSAAAGPVLRPRASGARCRTRSRRPGEDIFSTWNGVSGDGGRAPQSLSGTSMSSPFVAAWSR